MENNEVVYFDEAEASMVKEPKEFQDFMYDNDKNGGVLNKFDEIQKKIEEIKSNVQSLNTEYKNLQGIYEEFTDFNSTMNGNISAYNEAIDKTSKSYELLYETMKAQVNEIAKEDETFLEDMDNLTDSLKSEEDIAREVIQGKWGSGAARVAALTAAGYDAGAIQKIVNDMMNGTYNGGGSGAPATPAEPTPAPAEPTPAPAEPTPSPEPTPATFPQEPTPSGGNADNSAVAAQLGISEAELDIIKATIRHEAGNNPQAMYDVASCIRNRMTAGNFGGGSNPYALVTANGQFASYYNGYYKQYTGGNYYQGDAATAAQVNEILNGILLGTVPVTHNHHYFYGDGQQNHFYN